MRGDARRDGHPGLPCTHRPGPGGRAPPPGDAQAFARALVPLAYASRPKLRLRARRHFEAELSPAALGARLVGIYEALLKRRRAGPSTPVPVPTPGPVSVSVRGVVP